MTGPETDAVITFDSTHQAMAAEDHLRAAGFRLEVIPPPAALGAGCGLAIRVRTVDVPAVEAILDGNNVAFEGIHELGAGQEVAARLR